jgi:hypothetical protein
MKKAILILIIGFYISLSAQSQITIDSSDIGSPGDVISWVEDTLTSGLTVSAASPNMQTWDFSSLGATGNQQVIFSIPSSVPGGSQFPDANLALNLGGLDVFLEKRQDAIEIIGVSGDLLGQGAIVARFDAPYKLLSFPGNYGDSYNEQTTFDSTALDIDAIGTDISGVDSVRLERTVLNENTIDAWGEIILPNGTEQVLRIYSKETTTDVATGRSPLLGWVIPIFSNTAVTHYYRYIAKGLDYFVVEVVADQPEGNVVIARYQNTGGVLATVNSYAQPSCNGFSDGFAEASVFGGIPPFSYQWSDGQTTAIASNLTAGNYQVTASDGTGDSSIASIILSEPDMLVVSEQNISGDNGSGNGAIQISVTGGTAITGYAYEWSNGDFTQNINDLVAGDYTVTVTDDNGCQDTASFNVPTVSGLTDIEQSGLLSVFPNPVNDGQLFFKAERQFAYEVSITSLTGARLGRYQFNGDAAMNLSDMQPEIYFLSFQINGKGYFKKLILTD